MNIDSVINQGLYENDSKRLLLRYLEENTRINLKYELDPQRSKLEFYDKQTNKLIVSTEVERLAAYYEKYGIWVWAWSVPMLFHSENSLSIEILKHTLQLDNEYVYIKTIFTTSRGIIDDPIQIDINLALCGQLLKKPYIMTWKDGAVVWYIVLLNNEDLDKLASELELKDPRS